MVQLRGGDFVKIGGDFFSELGGEGENDNVNQALIPDARFCVSTSQYALTLMYVSLTGGPMSAFGTKRTWQ
jgi:hypothetical protein